MNLHASLSPYFFILVVLLFGAILGLGVSGISLLLGPKKENLKKRETYECGLPILSTAENRFSVKFYLTAILFILFDIETIFIYLWASIFQELGWFGITEIVLFVFTLVVGLVYVVRRGALNWDSAPGVSNQ